MSRDMKNTIIFWSAVLGGCAVFVVFPGVVAVTVWLVAVVGIAYVIWANWTPEMTRHQVENFVIGTIAGRMSRGKDIL